MDPAPMYSSASATAFNMAEIWQFPMSGGEAGGGLGLKIGQFGMNLGQFVNSTSASREVSGDDPVRGTRGSGGGGGGGGGGRKRREAEDEAAAKGVSTSSGNGMNDCDRKRLKTPGSRDEKNGDSKTEAQPSSGKRVEQNAQPPEAPPKQDYIHVRARRGQATDSHSLAERARREKISERMKILQDLVPGCNKVIGKALVLDEIINYIQSLQRQVEFLSMKLEAVNSRMNPGIEVFPPKEFGQQTFDTAGVGFGLQATREYARGSSPEWLHMQVGGAFERTT